MKKKNEIIKKNDWQIVNKVQQHNIFSFTMSILLKCTEVYFKSTVHMKPVPDWLLVLLVLFTVDYFYPIFSSSRTPWETADERDTMKEIQCMTLYITHYTYISIYVKLLSASPHLQFASLLLCTFYVKRNCQWYVQNHHSLVLGTWVKKKKILKNGPNHLFIIQIVKTLVTLTNKKTKKIFLTHHGFPLTLIFNSILQAIWRYLVSFSLLPHWNKCMLCYSY